MEEGEKREEGVAEEERAKVERAIMEREVRS